MPKTRVQRWNLSFWDSSYKMAIWHGKKNSTWNSSSTILYIHLFLFFFFLPNLVLCSSSSLLPFWIWFFVFFLPDMVLYSSKFGPLFFFFFPSSDLLLYNLSLKDSNSTWINCFTLALELLELVTKLKSQWL